MPPSGQSETFDVICPGQVYITAYIACISVNSCISTSYFFSVLIMRHYGIHMI